MGTKVAFAQTDALPPNAGTVGQAGAFARASPRWWRRCDDPAVSFDIFLESFANGDPAECDGPAMLGQRSDLE